MAHVVISRSFSEVVSLEAAFAHLRVWDTEDSEYIQSLIDTAVQTAESYLNRLVIESTVKVEVSSLCAILPLGVVKSVQSVEYFNALTEEYEVLDSSFYMLSPMGNRLLLKRSAYDLLTSRNAINYIVTMVTGWSSTEVPAPIKHGILLLVGSLYEMREDATVGVGVTVTEVPITHRYLFNKYKLYSV